MPAHSRLPRLALVLTLFSLPTLSPAQTPNTSTAPSKDSVLFDFDGGNFDGWTLSGDCWDKASATPKTFTDKQGNAAVTGIVGSGYLTTLYKNAATTGKATSKDFTIDKPFLTFKIGGGRYPKEACLNLLIDGKIVRTETGNDSATLVPASWDVSLLVGKTAHLEIVDATANPNRGYIMVDNIVPATHEELPDEPMPATTPTILRRFAKTVKDFRVRKGVYAEYGISQAEFNALAARITAIVIKPKFDHNPKMSLEARAKTIRDAVTAEVDNVVSETKKPVLLERMIWQGLYDWIRTHFHYSEYLAKDDTPGEVRKPFWDPKHLMAMPSPYCVCAGYGNTLVAMGKACGLDCFQVNGFARRFFDSSKLPDDPMKPWHKWAIMRQSDGLSVPADPTTSSIDLKIARQLPIDKWIASSTLPSSPEDWAIYAAVFYTTVLPTTGKAISESEQISTLEYSAWKRIEIANLKTLYSQHTGTVYWKTSLVE